jgi:hypothetical protein
MPVIDRSRFQPTDSGGMTGTFTVGGWPWCAKLGLWGVAFGFGGRGSGRTSARPGSVDLE